MIEQPEDLTAYAVDGEVVIRCTPAVAQQMADAWDFAHRLDEVATEHRPRWHDDVVNFRTAGITARLQDADLPAPVVLVPLDERTAQ